MFGRLFLFDFSCPTLLASLSFKACNDLIFTEFEAKIYLFEFQYGFGKTLN